MNITLRESYSSGDYKIDIDISKTGLDFVIWKNNNIILSGDRYTLSSIKKLVDKTLIHVSEMDNKYKETKC